MKVCANSTCGKEFEPRSKTQKYCQPSCCREATNRRILEKYHAEKARLAGEFRPCAQCGAPLSRYNEGILCERCDIEKTNNEYEDGIKEILKIASRRNKKK